MRTIFKPPEAYFSSCLQICLEVRAKRHRPFCRVLSSKPCVFSYEENLHVCKWIKPSSSAESKRLQETVCFARAEMKNILPFYAASFSRLWFCQLQFVAAYRNVCKSLQAVNPLESLVHKLRFPLELKESEAAVRGQQDDRSALPSAEYFHLP